MELNRRCLLKAITAAVALSAAGGIGISESVGEFKKKKLRARHFSQWDVANDQWINRIDVVLRESLKGAKVQYGVDFISENKIPDEEREIEPALSVLCRHIEFHHGVCFDIEVKTFESWQETDSNKWMAAIA